MRYLWKFVSKLWYQNDKLNKLVNAYHDNTSNEVAEKKFISIVKPFLQNSKELQKEQQKAGYNKIPLL